MSSHNHKPRKRFGQHFLHDAGVIQRIIAAIAPDGTTPVVEVGPGLGALTLPLLEQAGSLDVVEIDRDLAARLLAHPDSAHRLRVHNSDALRFDFCALHPTPIKVVGNLPYNISTPLLFHLLEQLDCIKQMIFMMQREVVERLCAAPGSRDYGRLSVMVQSRCRLGKILDVGPGAFQPPPKVDSCVVSITPDAGLRDRIENRLLFERLVRQAFSQRRKTLRNALKAMVNASQFETAGIVSTSRAEELTVEEFIELANLLNYDANQSIISCG